jgi:hypothetical protein
MHCLRSLGSRDRGFESHSGHGCLVFVCVCAFFCVCVHVEALRRADHPPKKSYRSETDSFMEVDQGQNWGCSAKGKKINSILSGFISAIYLWAPPGSPAGRGLHFTVLNLFRFNNPQGSQKDIRHVSRPVLRSGKLSSWL